MSDFLARPDLQLLPLPYIAERTRTAAFFVPTAPGAIQRLLDATLNAAASTHGQRFRPLLGMDYVALTFIHYPSLYSLQSDLAPEDRWGVFQYDECAVFLLLEDTQSGGLGPCWHVPFLILNDGIAMILGRVVYGMPKVMGHVSTAPLLADDWMEAPLAGAFSAAPEVFATRGAARKPETAKVAEVALKTPHPLPLDVPLYNPIPRGIRDFVGRLIQPAFFESPVFRLMQAFIGELLPGVFLKEFPSADGTRQAVYRRLLRADFTPTEIGAVRYVSAEAKLFDPASYPLASVFGVAPGVALPVSGIFAEISWVLPTADEL